MGATGDPVRRAAVSVRRLGQVYTVETNASGQFRVDGLSAGTLTLAVSRAGFLPSGGRELEIGYEARISGIVVVSDACGRHFGQNPRPRWRRGLERDGAGDGYAFVKASANCASRASRPATTAGSIASST